MPHVSCLLLVIALLVCPPTFAGETTTREPLDPLKSIAPKETLYLTNGEWAPYTSENLPHFGIATQIVTEALAQVNIHAEYRFYPWKRAMRYARKGRGDRISWHGSIMWIYTTERNRHFIYSDVVLKDQRALLFTNNNVLASLNTSKNLTIGLVDGTIYPLFERPLYRKRYGNQVVLAKAGDYPALLKRLQMKRVDAVYVEKEVGKYYLNTIKDPQFKASLQQSDLISEECRFHVVFNKNDVKNRFYRQQFNKGLARLKQTGRYQEILAQRHEFSDRSE